MKLLFESWRKFLKEGIGLGKGFEQWYSGESPFAADPTWEEPEFESPVCHPQSLNPNCLQEYGFEKIGEGSFREVWVLPDNPNYVMKTATGDSGDSQMQAAMNKAEADAIIQTGYPELVPKVYDTADDYRWIVVERVAVFPINDDTWVEEFFPGLVEVMNHSWEDKRVHPQYKDQPTKFFQDYLMLRRGELKGGKQSPDPAFKPREKDIWAASVTELGGPEIKKELDERMNQNPIFTKLLDLVTEQELGIWDIRSGNVGQGSDGRFVLLDLGYGMETGEGGKTLYPAHRAYERGKK